MPSKESGTDLPCQHATPKLLSRAECMTASMQFVLPIRDDAVFLQSIKASFQAFLQPGLTSAADFLLQSFTE
jgi:hypothetical protein